MFTGEYHYKVDDKGRVPMPAKFREELKGGMVLARGFEKCVVIYTMAQWKKLSEKQAIEGPGPSDSRRINRYMFARSFEAEMDSQGRIALPAPLREHGGITNAVAVVGLNTNLEIWSKDNWEEECSKMDEEAWRISEGIEGGDQ